MVFGGLLAGIGAVIGGIGIFRGSSEVGKAAEHTAEYSGKALESITNDVKELKTYFVKNMGPTITETLLKFQLVLSRLEELSKRAEGFIITATVVTKILALLLLLSAALICKYLVSEIERDYAIGRRRSVVVKLERKVVYFLYYVCISMAVVLVLHLITEISQISWPIQFPIIVIIPSIATLSMCLQHIVVIFKTIWKMIKQVIYCVFGLPIHLFKNPFSSGYTYYENSSVSLSMLVVSAILPLYSFALAFLLGVINGHFKRNVSPFQKVLASYVIFIITALGVYVIWTLLRTFVVRPVWAFTVKRNYRQR